MVLSPTMRRKRLGRRGHHGRVRTPTTLAVFISLTTTIMLLAHTVVGVAPPESRSSEEVDVEAPGGGAGAGGGGGLHRPMTRRNGGLLRKGISMFRGGIRRRDGGTRTAARFEATKDRGRILDQGEGESKAEEEGEIATDSGVGLRPMLPPTRPVRPGRPTRPGGLGPGGGQQINFMMAVGCDQDSCGTQSAAGCWCDRLCFQFGDCCTNACLACPCEVCDINNNMVDGCSVPNEFSQELCSAGNGYCGPPGEPTDLVAALSSDPQVSVELNWSSAASSTAGPAMGFSIHRRTDVGSMAQIGQITDGSMRVYNDTDTLQHGMYYYAVRATNDRGESGLSNEASVTIGPPPEAQLSCVPVGPSSSVGQGESGDWTCTVSSINGYTNILTPSCDAPSGFTDGFVPNSVDVPSDGTVDFTLTASVDVDVTPSVYDLTVEVRDAATLTTVEASYTVSVEVTASPSSRPSDSPSSDPSSEPSSGPSDSPSAIHSQAPSESTMPSSSPSSEPSSDPSSVPSVSPSSDPTSIPSSTPSDSPSGLQSQSPSESKMPSASPSSDPSSYPSSVPSDIPSSDPSSVPSSIASISPSELHSQPPSESTMPSSDPSSNPSSDPSSMPSSTPSDVPSSTPSRGPSAEPSSGPSVPGPDPPEGLTATALVEQSRIDIGWSAPSSSGSGAGSTPTSYQIFRRIDGDGYDLMSPPLATVDDTTFEYSDTDLSSESTTYHYAVRSVNSVGESDLSSEVTVAWIPPAPTCTDQTAEFDVGLGVPACPDVGCSCDSGPDLLVGRDDNGPESNAPNTLDDCDDGSSGGFHSDESLDRIVVRSIDGDFIRAGSTVEVVATVWAWSSYTTDRADFFHAEDVDNDPTWILKGTVQATQAGEHDLTAQFTLPEGDGSEINTMQAIRVQFRYNGNSDECATGGYSERDDIVFAVAPALPEAECAIDNDCPDGSGCVLPAGVCSSSMPSNVPSVEPSSYPSDDPSSIPSSLPSDEPSTWPSSSPSQEKECTDDGDCPDGSVCEVGGVCSSSTPSSSPSSVPSASPSDDPSSEPSSTPSDDPSIQPTMSPVEEAQCNVVPPPHFDYTEVACPDCCGSDPEDHFEVVGPDPNSECMEVVMKFYAFGDTPYGPADDTNAEFTCVRDKLLPELDPIVADFIAHVGDIRKGSHCCTESDFLTRKEMFWNGTEKNISLEETEYDGLDLFIVPGDNEWNDCGTRDADDCNDEQPEDRIAGQDAIDYWRDLFGPGSDFDRFNRTNLPSGVTAPLVQRQGSRTENFFFTYKNVGFWGINEADDYDDSHMDNAAWVGQKLSENPGIEAIVIIGHARLASEDGDVRDVLKQPEYENLPMLYLRGQSHRYCVEQGISQLPDLIQVTVDEGEAAPILISVLRDVTTGTHFFHVDRRLGESCTGAMFSHILPGIERLDSDDRYDFKLEALKKLEMERERGRMHRKED